MTPNELYARSDYDLSYDLSYLTPCSGHSSHVPELGDDIYLGFREQTKASVRIYKEFDYDGRRFWRLASVWVGEKPVMILQNAGREGTDHHRRFITDLEGYKELVAIAREYQILGDYANKELMEAVIPDDEPREDLDSFYGQSLGGPFTRYDY